VGVSASNISIAGETGAAALTDPWTQPAAEAFLTVAWSSALRGKTPSCDRPYWELGITSNRALHILRYIWQETGLDLPAVLFIEAPTIRAMAARLCEGSACRTKKILPLAGSGTHAALFMFAGGGGFLHELTELARALDLPGIIYGVTSSGTDGQEPICADHDEEAARAVELIRGVQPHGPYNIAGYSLGGCTALEAARRLRQAGEDVHLMMLDTGLSERCWPFTVWLNYVVPKFIDRVVGRIQRSVRKPSVSAKTALPDIAPARRGTLFEFRFRNPRHPDYVYYSPHWQSHHPPLFTRLRAAAIVIRALYRPTVYDGPVTFLMSAGGDPAACRPTEVWPKYLPNAKWFTVAGNHNSMIMGRHAKTLAATMTERLAWSQTAVHRAAANKPARVEFEERIEGLPAKPVY